MLLAIDQGNSDVVFGLHDGAEWIVEWRTPTSDKNASYYEAIMRQWMLDANLKSSDIEGIVLSSVVPQNKDILAEFVANLFRSPTVILGPEAFEKLSLKLHRPHEIGSDLVANAMAAIDLFPDQPAMVVDFGTALTVTSVNNNEILGVSIAPGLGTAVKALFKHTAQLPEVPLELPDSVLGQNTIHAIQSGVLHGYIGLVRNLILETKKEIGDNAKVVATGGLSSILKPLHDDFDLVDRKLTLNGLRVIYNKLN